MMRCDVIRCLGNLVVEGGWSGGISDAARLAFPITVVGTLAFGGLFVVRYLVSDVLGVPDGVAVKGRILPFERVSAHFFQLTLILSIFFLATCGVITLATVGANLLLQGAFRLFDSGPEAINRVRNLIVGLSAVVAALFTLWGAFG